MRKLMIVTALAMLIPAPVLASDSAEVMAVVQSWADAFSRGTFNTDIAPCAADAVVIDDLPPHVWHAPAACSKWFKAFEAWASKSGASNAALALGDIRHLEFAGDFAYLVAPVTLSYIKAGKAVNFPGIVTMALRKRQSGWRISGVAWADQ